MGHTQRCQLPQIRVNPGGLLAGQLLQEGNPADLRVPGTRGSESLGRPCRARTFGRIVQEAPGKAQAFIGTSTEALRAFHLWRVSEAHNQFPADKLHKLCQCHPLESGTA